MEYSESLILDGAAILYSLHGDLDPGELKRLAEKRYSDPTHADVRAYVWDCRTLNLADTPELRNSARAVEELRETQSDRRPAVVIVDRIGSAQYGMARMWQNTFSIPMKIVDSMDAAIDAVRELTRGT